MSALLTTQFDNVDGQGIVDLVRNDDRSVYVTIGGETAFETTPDTCRYNFGRPKL